jgi:TctA family transporter
MENNLRKSLIMSRGDFSIFFTRPLASAPLFIAFFLLVPPSSPICFLPLAALPSFLLTSIPNFVK